MTTEWKDMTDERKKTYQAISDDKKKIYEQ
jgi:hypothetical protein